jgi:hypothetical protein
MTYTPPSPRRLEMARNSGEVDPADPPAETPVGLITGCPSEPERPQQLACETSTTGKTAIIEREDGRVHHLPTDALFRGERIERDGTWYELYTPGRYQDLQRAAGHDPTPRERLDDPTHQPTDPDARPAVEAHLEVTA